MTTIEELRLRLDISQAALAGKAGVSVSALGQAESGRPVRPATVKKIAAALNVSPDDLDGIKYHSAMQAAQKRKRSKTEKPR